MSGVIAPWTGRFYSLWDTGYAKIHIPIIASVSEHQPTAWPNFFFDLNMLIWLLPAGIYFSFRELSDNHVFLILYSIFAAYFASVMVRLILTLTPIVCVLSGVAMSHVFETYLNFRDVPPSSPVKASAVSSAAPAADKAQRAADTVSDDVAAEDTDSASGHKKRGKGAKKNAAKAAEAATDTSADGAATPSTPAPNELSPGLKRFYAIFPKFVVMSCFMFLLCMFQWHCSWITSTAYSSPSVVLSSRGPDGSTFIIDDFREAYYWLRKNTKPDAKVLSWWDYGYQLAGMADRTTLVDNNTWNNTHIATVGKIMASDEDTAYELARRHDVDYVLVVFGAMLGYSGDDINKFLWMVRIAQGVYPDDIKEEAFYNQQGRYAISDDASPAMRNSLMHKLSYYRFAEVMGGRGTDKVRGQKLPTSVTLDNFEEAYTTENWMVRIYKVKDLDNLGRSHHAASKF
ncbi:oligosaccharyl transferase stt3 subunit [Coemansia linderi]|uniref:Oligosaccharyl transferase stt3 subunit n=1 Tax=Coemansia linderi TaxID=2663919 RepID=A0ACC1KBR6_9FUNG|nr:oligosaccharyl transferase stt3 subunit [Coemansia linderi]